VILLSENRPAYGVSNAMINGKRIDPKFAVDGNTDVNAFGNL